MLILALLLALSAQAPSRWQLPVTIEVLRDVAGTSLSGSPQPGDGAAREERGTLYIGRKLKPFLIKKGETFQMIKIGTEGGCRIRVGKSDYEVGSCPWLDGFRDHQADIFRVVVRN